MKSVNYNNINLYKHLTFFIFLYIILIIGFALNEDSTGGAFKDYLNQKRISEDFSLNFIATFLNFDEYATRHSPILIIFLSFFEKLNFGDNLIRLIHLHLCILLPILFFSILRKKYEVYKIENLFLLVGLIFLSPTFRSLSIWPDSKILGLIFFCVSIFFYLRFEKDKKFINCLFNIIFCAISAYVSPNYAVFAIFYFYKFYLFYKNYTNQILLIILTNITLSLPAFFYIFALDVNFLTKSAVIGSQNEGVLFVNFFNNFLLTSTIIFFYLFPFIFTRIIKLTNLIDFKLIIISLFLCIISIYFFDYKFEYTGGGIFFKFSNFFLGNNILFFIVSFISIYMIIKLCDHRFHNLLLIFLIFLSNPQISVYHKYYDPFLLITIFTLFNLNVNLSQLNLKINQFIIYSYFFSFLIISNLKQLWIN